MTSQCLGTGSFATVHLALDPAKHRQVACKTIRTKRDNEVGQVMKEVRILMTLKHVSPASSDARSSNLPLSPTSMRSTILKKTRSLCGPCSSCLARKLIHEIHSHIFLQLCTGGDLFTYITHTSETGNRICEAEAKYIMYQLLLGLKYLHEKLISHRGT